MIETIRKIVHPGIVACACDSGDGRIKWYIIETMMLKYVRF